MPPVSSSLWEQSYYIVHHDKKHAVHCVQEMALDALWTPKVNLHIRDS